MRAIATIFLAFVFVALLLSQSDAFRHHLHPAALRSNGFSDRSSSSGNRPTSQQSPTALNAVFDGIAEKMGGIVNLIQGQSTITEANVESTLKEIKSILIDADVNLQVTNSIIAKVKEQALGMKVESGQKPGEQFVSLLAKELVEIMGKDQTPLSKRSDSRPNTILMLGLQGAGKTTATAKLANWAKKQGYAQKILLVAADVYRPAAIEQLRTLGERLDVEVFFEEKVEGQDLPSPVTICRKAFAKATAEGFDLVIFDTAGRQVVDSKLMDELRQIKAVINPDEALLVVDAMTGQEAATLTATFNTEIGITGAVLTKMDGDTRGGSALSVRGVSGKPIKFVGIGEGMDDLEPFYPDRMASRILGLGDIKSFIEKAEKAIDLDAAAIAGKKMQKGDFDFNDFMQQIATVRMMGGMGGMLKMIPGMSGSGLSDEDLFKAEKRMKIQEQIVGAMTDEERKNPDLIVQMGGKGEQVAAAAARRVALAQTLGMPTRDVEQFVMEFIGMRKTMKANLKGMDMDAMSQNPNTPMETARQATKRQKIKPTRGGGGGFGAK